MSITTTEPFVSCSRCGDKEADYYEIGIDGLVCDKCVVEIEKKSAVRMDHDGTCTRLVEDLKKFLETTKDHDNVVINDIIKRASNHEYDDFHSPHPFPKSLLIDHLQKAKLEGFVKRVLNDDYD